MKKESGYTMLEITVTVILILLLLSVAVPNVISAVRSYRLRSAARDVAQILQDAKQEAIRLNHNYTITFDPTNNTVTSEGKEIIFPKGVQFDPLPNNIQAPTDVKNATKKNKSLTGQQTNAKIAISFPNGTSAQEKIASFNSKGLPDVEPGVLNWVYLKNTDGERVIIMLTSAGSTTILKYKKGGWVQ